MSQFGPYYDPNNNNELPTKAQIMRQASTYVPINPLNLPEGYHRADKLNPADLFKGVLNPITPDELQSLTNASSMEEALANYAITHSQGAQNVSRNQKQARQQRDSSLDEDSSNPPSADEQETDSEPQGVGDSIRSEGEVENNSSPISQPASISEDHRLPQLILNHRALQKAYTPLSYDEGYPMTPEGHPFWQKLPCEPIDAYTAFQGYLEQGTTGGRQLFVLSNNLNLQQRIAAIRCPQSLNHHPNHHEHQVIGPLEGSGFIPTSTFNQAKQDILHGASHDEFVEWFYLYHWDWRARSHDMFYLDSIKKSRDMMALQLENTHFSDAHALYGKLLAFMNPDPSNPNFKPYFLDGEGEPLFWKGLTPKTALEALKLTTQLQRISIGLHPTSTQHNSNSQRALASTPRSGDSTGSQNIAYLSSPSKRAEASTVSAKTEPTSEQPHDNQTLSASDRARRLAILLDKARSRKAG